jgi:hypothetical protein
MKLPIDDDVRTDTRADRDNDEVVDAVAEPDRLLSRRQGVGIVFRDDRDPQPLGKRLAKATLCQSKVCCTSSDASTPGAKLAVTWLIGFVGVQLRTKERNSNGTSPTLQPRGR